MGQRRKAVTAWIALKDGMLEPIKIPATEDSLMINISDAAKKRRIALCGRNGWKGIGRIILSI